MIAIIIFIVIFIIIVIVVIIWRFSSGNTGKSGDSGKSGKSGKSTSRTPTPVAPANAIKYGDTFNLFNTDTSFGGFMVTCGSVSSDTESICSANVSILPSSSTGNRWKLLSASGIAIGTAVKYGEKVLVQSTSNNGNLGYCGTGASQCGTNVGTFNGTNSNHDSSNWTIVNKGASTSIHVIKNNNIEIKNSSGDLLWGCGLAPDSSGSSCGTNVTNKNLSEPAQAVISLSIWQVRN